jgi:hypothetical protein
MMTDRTLSPADNHDDWLEGALRDDALVHRAEYLPDDGFTARVMAKLPAALSLPSWRTPAVAALWAAAGIGIALSLPGAYADVVREYLRIVTGHPVTLDQIATGVVMLGVASWTAMVWALRRN